MSDSMTENDFLMKIDGVTICECLQFFFFNKTCGAGEKTRTSLPYCQFDKRGATDRLLQNAVIVSYYVVIVE